MLPQLPRNLSASIRDLTHDRAAVRVSALADLVRHVDDARTEVIDALDRALEHDKDPVVRAAAADGLGTCVAEESLPRLLIAMEDVDARVRQAAIAALGDIRDPRALGRLERALEDERPDVRFQAIMAFVRVSTSESDINDALLRATKDSDELVVHIAFRMSEEARAGAEGPDGEIGPARPFDPRIVDRAVKLLTSKSPRVRAVAAIIAAEAGRKEAHATLVSALESKNRTPEHDDLAHIVELTGALGVRAAEPALLRYAFGGPLGLLKHALAWHARTALARMGNVRATQSIEADLSAWNREKRTLAVASVGQARLVALRGLVEAMRGDPRRAEPFAVDETLALLDGPEDARS